MGSCVSRSPASAAEVATAKVMDIHGSMAQFAAPVTAHEALGIDERRRASSFVCSSDELYFDAPVRALAAEEALQAGQLYFVLPLSMLRRPLSGQEMAALAVKASSALASASSTSRRKSADRAAAGKQRKTARVAPLAAAASGNEGEPDDGWDYHVYSSEETVGKTRKEAGYRGGTRRRSGVQRLSAILEASESVSDQC